MCSEGPPGAGARSGVASLRVLRGSTSSPSGFALVLTVVLLALLVLVTYSLSVLSRVGSDVAATGNYRVLAREHALLGLSQAIGALGRYASDDELLTGMAGVAGIPAGPNQPARHWCGVWDRDGGLFRWLASGAEEGPLLPALNTAGAWTLVASGSLGADGSEKEHVRALREPVTADTRDGRAVTLGSQAWWVGDEGVKLSAVLTAERHAIDALVAVEPDAPLLARVVSYEQVALVPAGVTPAALAGQLRSSFHALGRSHLSVTGGAAVEGRMNVNTTSRLFWRGVGATYNRLKSGGAPAISPVAFADAMIERLADADPGAGKRANGPYPSVDLFLNSQALTAALSASGGSLLDFGDVMHPWLAVRSDTFRVRAYGDTVNPSDPARLEATAWCEAIVQRVKDNPGDSSGRFIITYFRWLGPDDI